MADAVTFSERVAGRLTVLVYGVDVGHLMRAEDGFFVFWANTGRGYWPAYVLRAISDKLDALNAEWARLTAWASDIPGDGEDV